jgi:hypothetical protein
VRRVTTFYGLRFETSLFVASCDSQGYGGSIRPRLHTGSKSLFTILTYEGGSRTPRPGFKPGSDARCSARQLRGQGTRSGISCPNLERESRGVTSWAGNSLVTPGNLPGYKEGALSSLAPVTVKADRPIYQPQADLSNINIQFLPRRECLLCGPPQRPWNRCVVRGYGAHGLGGFQHSGSRVHISLGERMCVLRIPFILCAACHCTSGREGTLKTFDGTRRREVKPADVEEVD